MRVRTTLAAVAVVGAALVAGGLGLVLVLRSALVDQARTAARLRADDVVATLEATGTPPGLGGGDDDVLVQVLDAGGRVVAASPGTGPGPLATLGPGGSATVGDLPLDPDDDFVVVARGAPVAGGRGTVLVARSLDAVDESTRVVVTVMAIGLPALLLVVAATTWRVVGRALRPVEAMRSEVEAISAAELHRRLPRPGGSDEIARLADTLNGMLARLEGSQRRQRRFASDASHELRSPVAAIRQHAEVARAHPEVMSAASLAEVVLAEDRRIEALVEDLLLLARADEGGLATPGRPVDLDDLVLAEVDRLRATLAPGVAIDARGVSGGQVLGDGRQLRRACSNLLDNAVRHAAGRVAVSVTEGDGRVRLVVDDDGPGVEAGERERVFERFVRLDAARSTGAGGSGLGLAIVAEVVRVHGGTCRMEASPWGGARVEVDLPAAG